MASWNSTAMVIAALIAFLSVAEGFFFYSNSNNNKKTSTDRQFPPPPSNYYRDIGLSQPNNWGSQYSFDGTGPVTVALPVAVPIQAKMPQVPPSLKGTVHNVQLVPCLCPVSRDVDSPYLTNPSVPENLQMQQIQQNPSAYIVQSQQAPSQTT
ncbi:hypothetical protein GE061_004180 [Apolygus lucorum]|uniref:Uncharacterized protein n=1 Tax=Apolygus lucorum TaxID=248454 RepID=A0A6A4INX3_APOLU|nr:hypothetical protein GE061_004180 [Apolygus lucorum]